MKKSASRSAFFNRGVLFGLIIFFAGVLLTLFAGTNPQTSIRERQHLVMPQVDILSRVPSASPGDVHEGWVARYNGPANASDGGQAAAVDGSGNVYVTGWSFGSGSNFNYTTVKYGSAGQEQWVASYNGPGNDLDMAEAIAVDNSGNVYVTGFSVGSGTASDYATIKYNSAGREQWVARYNGPGNGTDMGIAIAVDNLGNVYVTGSSADANGLPDYVTIKYNSAGQEQWVSRYDDGSLDNASAIAVDSSGNVYVTGDSGGVGDYATIKYDSMGQEQWVARYNGPGDDADGATAIAINDSGDVYVTGFSVGLGSDFDYATIKYDSMGQEQWVARYNGPANSLDLAGHIALDKSGNVYVTGRSVGTTYPDYDYATIKYNSAGQEQWVARYDGTGNGEDDDSGLALDGSGNVYVTGSSDGVNSFPDYATIKYNSAGQEQWVARYDGPVKSYDLARAIVIDQLDNVYITGNSVGSGSGDDFITIKYVQGATTPTPTPRVTPTPAPTSTPTASPRHYSSPRSRPTPLPRPHP